MTCQEKIKSKKAILIISMICVVIVGTAGGLATFFLTKKVDQKRTEDVTVKNDKIKKFGKKFNPSTVEEDMKELENLIKKKNLSQDMKDIEDLIKLQMKNSTDTTKNTFEISDNSTNAKFSTQKNKPGKHQALYIGVINYK